MGFDPIKINAVLLPGFNEATEFVEWANREGYLLRFIEFMPPSTITRGKLEGQGPVESEILAQLEKAHGKVSEINQTADPHGKIAHRYGFENNGMVFEVIPGTSEPFCGTCNRIRLDCQGALRSCLYSTDSLQLGELISADDETFIAVVTEFISKKTGRKLEHIGHNMSSIGG